VNGILAGTMVGCAVMGGYTYGGYPALLWALGRRKPARRSTAPPPWPHISIVISAFNEEATIGGALSCLLEADYPPGCRQILVVSDASTDRTDAIVESFESRGVELLRMDTRGGKTRSENAALPFLRGKIIINTDAAMRVHPGALKELVTALADRSVGVASGRDVSVTPGELDDQARNGEGFYVGYEMWVRDLETRLAGIVGASGCLYAIREQLHRRRVREDLSRDFASALVAREAGLRAVSVPKAVCYVPRASSLHREYRRKVRTVGHGLLTLWNCRGLLNPFRYGLFSWMLFSHKVCRWLLPWAMIVGLALLGVAAVTDPVARWLGAAAALVLVIALVGWLWPEEKRTPRLVSLAAFAVAGNVAVIHASLRALAGRRTPIWEPTRRSADSAAVQG
jgi:glycosyltransferase involved in cell wall biosynthesis